MIVLSFSSEVFSQIKYSGKVETGYLKFIGNTLTVDAGPDWRGYYLEDENGFDFNFINGIKLKNKIFTGIGIGYSNFEGKDALSVHADIEYVPLKHQLSPLLNIKLGYSHLWNQYENGTGSMLFEMGAGLNYKVSENTAIYAKSGFLITQQAFLIPLRLGFRF